MSTTQLLQAGVDIINTSDGNSLPMPRVTAHAATDNTALAAHARAAGSRAGNRAASDTRSPRALAPHAARQLRMPRRR